MQILVRLGLILRIFTFIYLVSETLVCYGISVWRSEDDLQESGTVQNVYLLSYLRAQTRLLIGDVVRIRSCFPTLLPDLRISQCVKLGVRWAFTPSNQVNMNHPVLWTARYRCPAHRR